MGESRVIAQAQTISVRLHAGKEDLSAPQAKNVTTKEIEMTNHKRVADPALPEEARQFCDGCITTRWCEARGGCLAERLPPAAVPSPASSPAGTWLPISSAPEGVDILAFFPDANEEYQRMIVHRLEGDWYQQDADACPQPIDDVEPTHWQPLPSIPAGKDGETP